MSVPVLKEKEGENERKASREKSKAEDTVALAFARDRIDGFPVELWNLDRKVATLGLEGEPIDAIASPRTAPAV